MVIPIAVVPWVVVKTGMVMGASEGNVVVTEPVLVGNRRCTEYRVVRELRMESSSAQVTACADEGVSTKAGSDMRRGERQRAAWSHVTSGSEAASADRAHMGSAELTASHASATSSEPSAYVRCCAARMATTTAKTAAMPSSAKSTSAVSSAPAPHASPRDSTCLQRCKDERRADDQRRFLHGLGLVL